MKVCENDAYFMIIISIIIIIVLVSLILHHHVYLQLEWLTSSSLFLALMIFFF